MNGRLTGKRAIFAYAARWLIGFTTAALLLLGFLQYLNKPMIGRAAAVVIACYAVGVVVLMIVRKINLGIGGIHFGIK